MKRRRTLAELSQRAGGEFIGRRGRYALVRWDINTVSLESRESLLELIVTLDALNQILKGDSSGKN